MHSLNTLREKCPNNPSTTKKTKPSYERIEKELVKNEVLKLLDVGIIYPIFGSKWVSPTQIVTKKSRIIVVKNEKN